MKPAKKTKADGAIIGAASTIRGRITGDEDLIVLGRVEGAIDLGRGALLVERGALIRADIRAGAARISGAVVGNLSIADLLQLSPTARVSGDLRAGRLIVEPGAQVSGAVELGEAERAAPPRRSFEAVPIARREEEEPPVFPVNETIFDAPDIAPTELPEPAAEPSETPDKRRRLVLRVKKRAQP